MKRDLLKDAIADAKAVKETAIANAKLALEEAFTPQLKELFSQKLEELDETEDEDLENENVETEMNEVSLDELLAELEEGESEEEMDDEVSIDEILAEVEDDEDEEEGETEDMNIEDMSEEELKSFIEDVVQDMISSGELEAGEEETSEEDEEVSIDEILAEMEMDEEDMYDENMYEEDSINEYAETSPEEMLASICNDYPEHHACKNIKEAKKIKKYEVDEMKDAELDEAYNTIETIKSELEEVKLLNAKLLYTNKLFKSQNLTESQKVDRKSTRLNSSHVSESRMPSSA